MGTTTETEWDQDETKVDPRICWARLNTQGCGSPTRRGRLRVQLAARLLRRGVERPFLASKVIQAQPLGGAQPLHGSARRVQAAAVAGARLAHEAADPSQRRALFHIRGRAAGMVMHGVRGNIKQ